MTDRERPVFYYDLGSPYAYLAAERIHSLFDEPPVWRPILLGALGRRGFAGNVTGIRALQMIESS